MRDLPWQAEHQFGVFTTAQALEAGWSGSALTRAVTSRRLERVRPGAYVEPGGQHDRRLLTAAAAALTVPSATISHGSGALAHSLPLFDVPADHACVTLPPHTSQVIPGLHVHRSALQPMRCHGTTTWQQ